MASAKPGHVLIEKYCKLYEETYGSKPSMNRFKRQWGFADMANDLGLQEAGEVIAYFFSVHSRNPQLDDLLYNYDKYKELKDEAATDAGLRKKQREKTRQMVLDWEDKYGQQL